MYIAFTSERLSRERDPEGYRSKNEDREEYASLSAYPLIHATVVSLLASCQRWWVSQHSFSSGFQFASCPFIRFLQWSTIMFCVASLLFICITVHEVLSRIWDCRTCYEYHISMIFSTTHAFIIFLVSYPFRTFSTTTLQHLPLRTVDGTLRDLLQWRIVLM